MRSPILRYQQLVLASNPVAYFRLGEASGNILDSSVNNLGPGTPTGSLRYGVTGPKPGDLTTAIDFSNNAVNSAAGYLSIPDNSALDFTDVVTVEGWIYLNATTASNYHFLSKTPSIVNNNGAWRMYINTSNQVVFGVNNGGSGFTDANSPMSIKPNTWYHVVGVWDGTKCTVYLNAVPGAALTSTGPFFASTSALVLGGRANPLANFPGFLQDVAIYNAALSVNVIRQHYLCGLSIARTKATNRQLVTQPRGTIGNYHKVILADNPVSYWRLGESSGSVAADLQGVNNGTYTGSTVLGQTGAIPTSTDTSVNFNAAGYVAVADNASIHFGNGPFSVECWIFSSGVFGSRFGVFSTRIDNVAGEWMLEVGAGSGAGILNRVAVSGIGTWLIESVSNTLLPNQWNHIVYTRDGSGNQKLYVNGYPANLNQTNSYTISDTGKGINIGAGTLNGQFYPSKIDEVALYNTVLTTSQVLKHFLTGQNQFRTKIS